MNYKCLRLRNTIILIILRLDGQSGEEWRWGNDCELALLF